MCRRTAEVRRVRTAAQQVLSTVKAELALLADHVSAQVASVNIKEQTLTAETEELTAVRNAVWGLQNKLRGLMLKNHG